VHVSADHIEDAWAAANDRIAQRLGRPAKAETVMG
jgi:hypothetical protein